MFLIWNKKLKNLELPTLEYIGENFLQLNSSLKYLYTPNVIYSSNKILNSHPKQNKFVNSINKTINSNLKKTSHKQKNHFEENNNYELE